MFFADEMLVGVAAPVQPMYNNGTQQPAGMQLGLPVAPRSPITHLFSQVLSN
jgi:hypothetical protein